MKTTSTRSHPFLIRVLCENPRPISFEHDIVNAKNMTQEAALTEKVKTEFGFIEQTDKFVAGKQDCCYIDSIQFRPLSANLPWRKTSIKNKKAVRQLNRLRRRS
jgi:hypothetical protein